MQILRVRHRDSEIHVGFKLSRFIADWPSAQLRFIAGIADGFRGRVPIGPRNFSVTPAFALEDLRCKCRLFDGRCEIVLAPETLHLDFKNVKREGRPVVMERVRRASEWLAGALGDHGRDLLSFQTLAHMEALDADAADAYLGQFVPTEDDELLQSEPDVKRLPSSRTLLSGEAEGWMLERVIEKSLSVNNAVFVSTQILVQSSDSREFDDELQLLDRVEKLADRVVGLDCEEA